MRFTEKLKRGKSKLVVIMSAIIFCLGFGGVGITKYVNASQVKSELALGNKYLEEGQYEEAILAFEKTIKIDPKNISARLGLGKTYLLMGKEDEARKTFREVIDINPDNADEYISISEIYMDLNWNDEALLILREGYKNAGSEKIKSKMDELQQKIPVETIEAAVNQNDKYVLPSKVRIKINNSDKELEVQWEQTPVDTTKGGEYTFNGVTKEYERKVTLKLIVSPVEKEIQMDKYTKIKLDTFFSNFSEAFVEPFEDGNISNEALIHFGIMHIIKNNWSHRSNNLVEERAADPNNGYIKDTYVDNAAYYYFGKRISAHKSIQDYPYKNGYYIFPFALGEGPTFSQINKLYDLGDNYYKAEISVYYAYNGFEGDPHGTMNDWEKGEFPPELEKNMVAKIKKVFEDGKERYILISYKNY